MAPEETVTDEVMVSRVRSEFGRIISHPKSIYVLARNGEITLSGQILRKELNKLIGLTCRVRGVRKVNNQLDVFDSAGKVPGLQGKGPEYLAA
jgi:osmotically-inducible protein OsmY